MIDDNTIKPKRRPARLAILLFAGFMASLGSGCAAITNPVADGIPVRRLPPEILETESRANLIPIDLTLLRQKQPEKHIIDGGDILGIFIENVIGERNQLPPVRISDVPGVAPAIGYPFVVSEDGTVTLPYVDPIDVKGLSVPEAQLKIKKLYTDKEILKAGFERVFVTLIQPREVKVTVFREDGGATGAVSQTLFGQYGSVLGTSKRGSSYDLKLPAYQNDVLTALSKTGGLPGTEVKNEVIIYRKNKTLKDGSPLVQRIPLKVRPGDSPKIKTEDIILENGDAIYLEARDAEVFYTAGLIGAGQYQLPRDYDLDIVQAIAQVRGPLVNGGYTQNAFVAQSVNQGLGNPSPSLVSVIRKLPNNQQLNIRVDLNLAMKDPRERIMVQPGDLIVMQETSGEALARYFSGIFRLNFAGTIIKQTDLNSSISGVAP
ncbi:polysaccharide biosynthesis/export family protein [Telmatocola sphagniphila]|uniref:Polysaccharide biosynthesis/export family protein n=1 Tax=Telmatocola sphagniphila TaxID=1123043 RepID=A0A8E6B4W3_9BACT|nr:polysaccharide biosynthesis/export family protein [Telmatocola sphagniphila]QVL31161.1 polysaccharide biosynthesis/export family protein [Telmatocola sphagniphila]